MKVMDAFLAHPIAGTGPRQVETEALGLMFFLAPT